MEIDPQNTGLDHAVEQTQGATAKSTMEAKSWPSLMFSGESKVEFCRRLGPSWRELADYLEIPTHEQTRFERGNEARGIWDWLEQRNQGQQLTAALEAIGRGDLLAHLLERQRTDLDNHYRGCIERWAGPHYDLDRRFVQLSLLLDQGEQAQGPRWAAQEGKYQDLRDVLLAIPEFPALVLLGPPGSGKSTLLRHTELDVARDALRIDKSEGSNSPFTFFVELSLYKHQPPGKSLPSPRNWLEQRWLAQFPDQPPLDNLLRDKRMLFLLDAINEMPHQGAEHIAAWRDFLALLATERPGNRVIFSCRTQDYGAKLSTKELPVPQVRLERLSDNQVREFVEKYLTEGGGGLWGELRRSPRQLDLYRSPYYLRMLVDQAGPKARIPVGRAALFSTFVRQTLNREIAGDDPAFRPGALLTARDCEHLAQDALTGCILPDEGPLFSALSRLAYRMQETETSREDSQIRIEQEAAVEFLGKPIRWAGTGILARFVASLGRRLGATRPGLRQAAAILKAGEDLQILEQDRARRQVLFTLIVYHIA